MSIGYTPIRVLEHLNGKPWDVNARAFLRALRPSETRVTFGEVKSDAKLWRVTVFLKGGNVDYIEQEVEVDLPEGVSNGYQLMERVR